MIDATPRHNSLFQLAHFLGRGEYRFDAIVNAQGSSAKSPGLNVPNRVSPPRKNLVGEEDNSPTAHSFNTMPVST